MNSMAQSTSFYMSTCGWGCLTDSPIEIMWSRGGLGMLGTQNSKEIRLPDAHKHHAHKAIVNVKRGRRRLCHEFRAWWHQERFLRVKELSPDESVGFWWVKGKCGMRFRQYEEVRYGLETCARCFWRPVYRPSPVTLGDWEDRFGWECEGPALSVRVRNLALILWAVESY